MRRRLVLVLAVLAALLVPDRAGAVPATPTLVTAVSRDAGVAVTWTAVSGATSYKLFRGLTAGFTCGTPVASGLLGTSYTDTGLLNKVRYYYKLKATDGTGDSATCSNELNAVPGVQPYLWDFNRAATFDQSPQEGWYGTGATWSASGGYLKATTVSTTDPAVYTPTNLGIAAAANPTVTVSIANYWSAATNARLFWITDADQLWGTNNKFKDFTITAFNTGVYTVTMPAAWTGTIDQIRLDPNDPGVVGTSNIWIDYLKVGTVTTPPTPLTGAIFFPNQGSKGVPYKPQVHGDYDFNQAFYGYYDDDHPDHQKLMDEQIIHAKNAGIDYFAFYFYGSWDARTENLVKYIEDFRNSTVRGSMKYMLHPNLGFNICGEIPDVCGQWVGGGNFPDDQIRWRTEDVPWLLERMNDSYYLRVEGNRPALTWCCGPITNLAGQWIQYQLGQPETVVIDGFGDCSAPLTSGCWSDELNFLRDSVNGQPIEGGGTLGEPYNVSYQYDTTDNATLFGFPAARLPLPVNANWQNFDRRASFFSTAKQSNDAFGITAPGVKNWPGIRAVNDHRAYNCGSGAWWWADNPTYGQWEDHYRYYQESMQQFPGRYPDPPAVTMYAWNELFEGGAGIAPTVSEGSLYLDAIKAVKNGSYASKYYDLVNDSMMSSTTTSTEQSPTHIQELYVAPGTPLKGMQFSSGWTWVSPTQFNPGPIQYDFDPFQAHTADDTQCGGQSLTAPFKEPYFHTNDARGMYFNDEHTSSTTGNSMSLPWANATGFSVIAATGPDRGYADISIDGGAPTTIDLYSATMLRQRRVFNVTGLTPGVSHTITVTVKGAPWKNAASTGYKVGIDAIRAQVDRGLTAAAQTTTPPTRFTADRNDGRVELSWDRVPGAATYHLYRGPINGFNSSGTTNRIAIVNEPASSDGRVRFTNSGLVNGATYYYVVKTNDTSAPISTQVSGTPLARLTAVATSSNAGGVPDNATDGDHATAWTPSNGNPGTYLQVDLAAAPNPGVSVSRFYVKETGAKVNGFKIRYSTDYGATWFDYYTGTGIGETGAFATDYLARSISVPLVKNGPYGDSPEIKVTNIRFELTTATTGGPPEIRVFHPYFR